MQIHAVGLFQFSWGAIALKTEMVHFLSETKGNCVCTLAVVYDEMCMI